MYTRFLQLDLSLSLESPLIVSKNQIINSRIEIITTGYLNLFKGLKFNLYKVRLSYILYYFSFCFTLLQDCIWYMFPFTSSMSYTKNYLILIVKLYDSFSNLFFSPFIKLSLSKANVLRTSLIKAYLKNH